MKKNIIAILVFILLVALIFGSSYNRLITAEENVTASWSQVENVYQRRMDLISNLVSTVKGYANHEKTTLLDVTEARSKISLIQLGANVINDPQAFNQFQQNQGHLSSALSRLMVVSEQYPDLKANESFLLLQNQLEGAENRIAIERMRFNQAAQEFNTLRKTLPTAIIAKFMGLGEKIYFKSDDSASKAPEVKF